MYMFHLNICRRPASEHVPLEHLRGAVRCNVPLEHLKEANGCTLSTRTFRGIRQVYMFLLNICGFPVGVHVPLEHL